MFIVIIGQGLGHDRDHNSVQDHVDFMDNAIKMVVITGPYVVMRIFIDMITILVLVVKTISLSVLCHAQRHSHQVYGQNIK